MTLKDRLKEPGTMMRVGFACLALGNLLHWFVRPAATPAQGLVDGIFGLLIGVSVGCLLLSLRRKAL